MGASRSRMVPVRTPVVHDQYLFIWDFDCTITVNHTGGFQTHGSLTLDAVKANIKEEEIFRNFVLEVVGNPEPSGHFVAIATYSDDTWNVPSQGQVAGKPLVNRYLDVVFGRERHFFKQEDFQTFMAPIVATDIQLQGKNKHIANILEMIRQRHKVELLPSQVYLFDDQPLNCEKARVLGYNAINVIEEPDYLSKMLRRVREEKRLRGGTGAASTPPPSPLVKERSAQHLSPRAKGATRVGEPVARVSRTTTPTAASGGVPFIPPATSRSRSQEDLSGPELVGEVIGSTQMDVEAPAPAAPAARPPPLIMFGDDDADARAVEGRT